MSAVASPDAALEWERTYRVRGAIAAFVAAVLNIAGYAITILAYGSNPQPDFGTSLARLDGSEEIGRQHSLLSDAFARLADHGAGIIAGGVVIGLATVAIAGALTYLGFATRNRAERFPRLAIYLPTVAGAGALIGYTCLTIGQVHRWSTVADSSRTVDVVRDIGYSQVYYVGGFLQIIAALALALSFVLLSINALRVGLLTRFMGLVGVIAGGLIVLPLGPAVPVLQSFWLVALGFLFLGIWPRGAVPPAWKTGKAEPWPSAAQQRADAAKAAPPQKARDRRAAPQPEAVEERAGVTPHPSSKKKRKRRN